MSTSRLKALIMDDDLLWNALAVFKVGVQKGDQPVEAFRRAMAVLVATAEGLPLEDPKPLRSHDERVALANGLMRDHIDPATRPIGEGALLLVFPTGRAGVTTYIANAEKKGCRALLRDLLARWDAEAAERGER